MAYQLLVLDVDGTFLRSDKTVSAAVMSAVRRLADSGFGVAFASGRMYEALQAWVEELELRTPQVCNNGATIIDPRDGRRLQTVLLSSGTVAALLDYGREHAVTTVLFSGSRVLGRCHSEDHWLIERNNERVEILPEPALYARGLPVEKLLFLDRFDPGRMARIRDCVPRAAGTEAGQFVPQISEPGILNFSPPTATKVRALEWVCKTLGIDPSQVIAIGDGDNDADVLAWAGLGIAMGNASSASRAAAQRVVPDNDHDGVAVAISDIVRPLLGE